MILRANHSYTHTRSREWKPANIKRTLARALSLQLATLGPSTSSTCHHLARELLHCSKISTFLTQAHKCTVEHCITIIAQLLLCISAYSWRIGALLHNIISSTISWSAVTYALVNYVDSMHSVMISPSPANWQHATSLVAFSLYTGSLFLHSFVFSDITSDKFGYNCCKKCINLAANEKR